MVEAVIGAGGGAVGRVTAQTPIATTTITAMATSHDTFRFIRTSLSYREISETRRIMAQVSEVTPTNFPMPAYIAGMKHTLALHTLKRLYAELSGEIKKDRGEIARLNMSKRHVCAVIKLLDPSFDVATIRPKRKFKPKPYFKRRTIWPLAIDVMREAEKPLTAEEIGVRLLALRGVSDPPRGLRRDMRGSVHRSIQSHNGKTVTGDGGYWSGAPMNKSNGKNIGFTWF
jgi:hypothetical protein